MERLTLNTAIDQATGDDESILIPPEPYIAAVRRTLGIIDLDPCSSRAAQNSIDAQGWFKAADASAALAEPWSGRVFLHPHPNATIARYQLQKLIRDYLADRVSSAIILAGKSDWLRQEPLLLSFPFALHYRRLTHWKVAAKGALERVNPSFNSVTIYLPAKSGGHFNEAALATFLESFSSFGRVIIAEDLGDGWEQDAQLASVRMPIKPILTAARIDRYGDRPSAHDLFG
jgi:hypothetical protein